MECVCVNYYKKIMLVYTLLCQDRLLRSSFETNMDALNLREAVPRLLTPLLLLEKKLNMI